jgi:predicted SprT family Zn-dependent metalloprotease
METTTAARLARSLMNDHGLGHWSFQFDRAVRRLGVCNYRTQTIGLSKQLTALNDEDRVRNTILHEIAHALVGSGHGHDYVWQAKARQIGCDGQRCADAKDLALPTAPWVGTCPGCGKTTTRHRLTKAARTLACGRCCGRRYNPAFQLVWKRQRVAA